MNYRWLQFAFLFSLFSPPAFAEFSEAQLYTAKFDACSTWNAKDWDSFKIWVMKDYPDESRMQSRLETFRKYYGKCQPGFSNPDMTACLERMDYIGKITINAADSNIHAWKNNLDYYASQNEEMMSPPPEFANGLPKDWMQIANDKGWMCVTFKSKLATHSSIGDAMYRTIFLRPMKVNGKDVMQRFMVTSLTPDPTVMGATLQIISTEHQYDGRNDGFDKGARMNYRGYDVEEKGFTKSTHINSCVECHMTGPIRVKPDSGYDPKLCGNYDLKAFNEKLLNDSTMPNQENLIDARLHPQPAMGNFPISKDGKVGVDGPGAVHCIDCHTEFGGIRNPLLVGTNYALPLSELPMWRVELDLHRNMPPGANLSNTEWAKAKDLLRKEQIDGIRNWLMGIKCDKAPASGVKSDGSGDPKFGTMAPTVK